MGKRVLWGFLFLVAIIFIGCESQSVSARKELHSLGIEFNPRTYYDHVRESDIVVVKLFLDAGMPPNSDDALNAAVRYNNTSMAKLLIKYGAKPKGEDLYVAIDEESYDMSKLLLQNGVDPNAECCICNAIYVGNIEIVRLLIQFGLKINQLHEDVLPLARALDRGEYEIAKLLMDHGGTLERWHRDEVPLTEIYADELEEIRSLGVGGTR